MTSVVPFHLFGSHHSIVLRLFKVFVLMMVLLCGHVDPSKKVPSQVVGLHLEMFRIYTPYYK